MDALLTAHCATRDARLAATAPQIDRAHYVGDVLLERSQRYAAHVASMTIAPAVAMWALAMSQAHGSYVLVNHFVADWVTALLIVRYGEEPDAALSSDPDFRGWPVAFTSDDLTRAQSLLSGKWPTNLVTLER